MGQAIHFVGGEKGGVGKSFVCKLLVSYYLRERGKCFAIFECDDVNLDIFRVYEGAGFQVESVVFSKAEKELSLPNKLLSVARQKDVIVNLPAGVHKLVGEWFKISRVKELAGRLGIRIYLWYVCDGDRTNLRLFSESQSSVPIEHVFVRNMVRLDDVEWEAAIELVESEGVRLGLGGVACLRVERLDYWLAQALAQKYLSFEKLLGYEDERIGFIEQEMAKLWLEDMLGRVREVMVQISGGGALRGEMRASEELERRYEAVQGEARDEDGGVGVRLFWYCERYPEMRFSSREEAIAYGLARGDEVLPSDVICRVER